MDDTDKIYEVIIQAPATEMLVDHARFLAHVSETAADRLVDDFYAGAKSLQHIPERCPRLSGYSIPEKKYRKFIIGKYYMLVFQITGNKVYIDAMVDCRSEYQWLLSEE